MNIQDELSAFFKGDIDISDETLTKYSHDASILEVRPVVVVYPKDAKDISALVKWVTANKPLHPELSITVRAAGTCMSGGAIGESIVMDTTRYMNTLKSVRRLQSFNIVPKYPGASPVSVTGEAVVLPGCFYRDFEEATLKENLLLPCYTASKSINAVGGMVGNNSAGEKTLRYGKTEDYVKELKVILSDGYEYIVKPITKKELYVKMGETGLEGDIYRSIFQMITDNRITIETSKPNVSKNSAGYYLWNVWNEETEVFDLTKLIVGSQGTLGIVTEITFHLVDVKPKSTLAVVFMKDITNLGLLVDRILPFHPESVESYDNATMMLAIKFFPDFLKKKGFWGMIKFMWSFVPEALLMLANGMPKLILLVEFAGNTDTETRASAEKLLASISDMGYKTRVTKNHTDSDKYWDIRRESFALLRKHVHGKHTAPFIDDIIVRPEFLPEFLPKLRALIAEYPITYTIAGHAGNGNFHIIPLMDFADPRTKDIVMELSKRVYDLVLAYKGSTTAEHNDGIIRTPFLRQMYGDTMYTLFENTKKLFDRQNILNPGKKVGGSIEYTQSHILIEAHKKSHKI